ncbi:MAG: ecdysteroid 22-kinase family protein, partial [Gammaproteobacteria bacterium]|nr:ecdysteroid 22-kinase family protein [Gammaproteobacteria bacterium]
PERTVRFGESFAMEARFYREVAPSLPVRIPACLAHGNDFILLERIEHRPFSWQRGATETHAATAMEALRSLHELEAKDVPDWIPGFAEPECQAALCERYCESWGKHADSLCRWCPEFKPVGEHLASHGAEHYAALGGSGALLHGDAHLENIPLTEEAQGVDVVFFDWQGPRRGEPLFDVAYFNIMSFPVDARRAKEPALLARYLGHAPDSAEQATYRHSVASRASGIVEMTADWSPKQVEDPGLGWVANRCFTAAVDHRVHELIG